MLSTLSITSLYAAIFGVILFPITVRVGLRRAATNINFLDGGDEILLRRMRSHGNFLEYVPFALLLMALAELNGAPSSYLHAMGSILLVSRLLHYFTLNIHPTAITRPVSMLGTFTALLMAPGWLFYALLT